MSNYNQTKNDHEIDLKLLFLDLWRGKVLILFFSLIFIFFASMYLHDAERKYLVEFKLKPVNVNQKKNAFSGMSGIASLTGIKLPSSPSSDFEIFQELITSSDVSAIVLKNKQLMKKIYASEWNPSLNSFTEPPKSKLSENIGTLRRALTGSIKQNYMPPNARRLAIYISSNIIQDKDKKNGFLTLRANTSKPDMLSSLISEVIGVTDNIMRQRYINFSKEPLAFYKEKIRTARSREHRQALAELIGQEEQKLMLASLGKYFTAEPYIDPTISLYPTSPKPKLVLLLSLILGLLTGCVITILRNALLREKNEDSILK